MPNRTVGRRRFRLAVDTSPAAMIMVDVNGVIEFSSADTQRMFGYSAEELIGQSIDMLVPVRLREAHAGARPGFFANPGDRPSGAGRELNGTRKDGVEFPVEIAVMPIGAESGPIVLAIVDITGRKQAESELARRTSELELANERLARFAYVASHDLQEPLRKIAAYAGLLDEALARSDAADIARATSVISSSAVRARRLVENLLTFARVTGSQARVQSLDLRAEVESVVDDRMQLGRLLQNIVSNAIKYHKPGAAPAIDISARLLGHREASLSITDEGIGFEEKFAREIFEPFKRLNDLNQYPGTGIGLAICKAIADQHGWTLGAVSRPGEGATFHIILPASPK
jgi:PAS domain S-box-containing protein